MTEEEEFAAAAGQSQASSGQLNGIAQLYGAAGKPDEAAKALKIGRETGLLPEYAISDPQTASDIAHASRASAISAASPAVASWAQGAPLKVAATKDDFGSLGSIAAQVGSDFLSPLKGMWSELQRGVVRTLATDPKQAFAQGVVDATKGGIGANPQSGNALANSPFGSLYKPAFDFMNSLWSPMTALTNPAVAPLARAAAKATPSPGTVDAAKYLWPGLDKTISTEEGRTGLYQNFGNLVAGGLLGHAVGSIAGRPRVGPKGLPGPVAEPPNVGATRPATPPPSGPAHFDGARWATTPEGFVADAAGNPVHFSSAKEAGLWQHQEGYAQEHDQIFEPANAEGDTGTYHAKQVGIVEPSPDVPHPGASESADLTRGEVAEIDAKRVEDLEGTIAKSPSFARDPALVEEFLQQHAAPEAGVPDASVWVDPRALGRVYEQGHTPFADMLPEISAAMERGSDVEIPAGKYLSEVAGKPFADELRQATRFRQDGLSQEEAKTATEHHEAVKVEPVAQEPVATQVSRQFSASGRFSENQAKAAGMLASAHYDAVGKAFGTSAQEEFARAGGLKVEKGTTRGKAKGELAQSGRNVTWHGSASIFPKFDWSKIGTGEGAQVYSYGLYVAGRKGIAKTYREQDVQRKQENAPYDPAHGNTIGGVAAGNFLNAIPDFNERQLVQGAFARHDAGTTWAEQKADLLKELAGYEKEIAEAKADGAPDADVLDIQKQADQVREIHDTIAKHLDGKEIVTQGKKLGRLYRTEIPGDEKFLNWDEPIDTAKLPEKLKSILKEIGFDLKPKDNTSWTSTDLPAETGQTFYNRLKQHLLAMEDGDDKTFSELQQVASDVGIDAGSKDFHHAGALASRLIYLGSEGEIAGMKYADASSRSAVTQARSTIADLTRSLADRAKAIKEFERDLAAIEAKGLLTERQSEDADSYRQAIDRQKQGAIEDQKEIEQAKKDAEEATHNYVLYDDSLIHILDYEQKERALVNVLNRTITAFSKADSSTIPHEFTHLFLHELEANTQRPDAPEQMQKDLETLREWAGLAPGKSFFDADSVDANEQVARGAEAYFREGKAPNEALKGVFQRFKDWLERIYRSAKELNVELTDEVRAVFARMFDGLPDDIAPEEFTAEDASVADTQRAKVLRKVKELYLDQMFQGNKSLDMLKGQYAKYSSRIQAAVEAATQKLHDKLWKQIRREREPQWKEALAQHRADVEQEFSTRRDFSTAVELTTGKDLLGAPVENYRMDKAAAVRSFGLATVDSLPKTMFKRGGMRPDDAAEAYGYDSGDEMFSELLDLEKRKAESGAKSYRDLLAKDVQDEAEARTKNQLGWDFTPEDIERAASEAMSTPAVSDILADQLQDLGKQEGYPFSKDQIAARADEIFSGMTVKDALNIREHERMVGRAGREAELALLANKPKDAFQAKQKQFINHLMLQKAHELTKLHEKAMKSFDRWRNNSTIAGMDQKFLNYIHAALIDMGMKVKRNPEELLASIDGVPFDKFVDNWEKQGYVIEWGDLSKSPVDKQRVDEFKTVAATLNSIAAVGRKVGAVASAERSAQLNDVLAQIKENADKFGRDLTPKRQSKKSLGATASRAYRGFLAPTIRMEQLAQDFDGEDPNGPLMKYVMQPLQAASGWEKDTINGIHKDFEAFFKTQPKEWMGTMADKITTTGLADTGIVEDPDNTDMLLGHNGGPVLGEQEQRISTRGEMVRAVLNTGTEGNYRTLLMGYGWDREVFERERDKFMRPEDWKFVQKVWETHAALWPKVEQEYRELTGIAPVKVEGRMIDTPFGQIKGDYFPIKHDPIRAPEKHVFDEGSMFGKEYSSALPANPHAKGRTGYIAPIALDFDTLFTGMSQAVHDLAFRRPLLQATRIMTNPGTLRAIQDVYGVEFKDQVVPWLKYIARQRVSDQIASAWMASFLRQTNSNVAFVGIGYNPVSALIHGGVAAADSMGEVGPKYLGRAVRDLYMSPGQNATMKEFIHANSAEVRNRALGSRHSLADISSKLEGEQGFLWMHQHFAFHMIGAIDNASAEPTWLGRYYKATEEEGMEPKEAFAAADLAVRNAHGASSAVDLPDFLRSGRDAFSEMGRQNAAFLSFQNHALNRTWRTVRQGELGTKAAVQGDWAGARRNFSAVAGRTMAYILIAGAWVAEMDAEREGHLIPTVDNALRGITHTTIGAVPMASMVLGLLERGEAKTPFEQMGKAAHNTFYNAWNISPFGNHTKVTKHWASDLAITAGVLTRTSTAYEGRAGQYLWDFSTGKEHPKDVQTFIHGLIYGPQRHRHKK